MLWEDIRNAITPLRLVFWGGLICILDFNISQTVMARGGGSTFSMTRSGWP